MQPLFARPAVPVAAPAPAPAPNQAQPMDILQEILRQQQVLRLQQEAIQLNQPLPAAAAAGAPDQLLDDGVPIPVAVPGLPPAPALPLNALQAWQLQWQQQHQQQLQHLQPFLADPMRPVRPGIHAPPGAVQA